MNKFWKRALVVAAGLAGAGLALAGGPQDLAAIQGTMQGTFKAANQLITGAAYVAGFGLIVAGIFKFKQHKENPQQTPMSTAITILSVGAALVFFPSLIGTAGQSLFGADATGEAGSTSGESHADSLT